MGCFGHNRRRIILLDSEILLLMSYIRRLSNLTLFFHYNYLVRRLLFSQSSSQVFNLFKHIFCHFRYKVVSYEIHKKSLEVRSGEYIFFMGNVFLRPRVKTNMLSIGIKGQAFFLVLVGTALTYFEMKQDVFLVYSSYIWNMWI